MVGEHFEMCISEMARNVSKLSTIVEEIFEICIPEMARNVLKLYTTVEENFEILSLKYPEMD